ncbi:MerR family transcriptional regulator [Simplicispira psychrophila]|uniref:MerR family transcriptional regulator n=1 Tax=Simplicispira psychrophila TaxID=80882 RepID=UPI00055D23BC
MSLPLIPAKRYFTIGEVAQLCGVKPHVLRYWEQEFTQLRPMKRRGNRRYYQHHEVLMIRRIRDLLYDEGFTISGARNKLREAPTLWQVQEGGYVGEMAEGPSFAALHLSPESAQVQAEQAESQLLHLSSDMHTLHKELCEIRALLAGDS